MLKQRKEIRSIPSQARSSVMNGHSTVNRRRMRTTSLQSRLYHAKSSGPLWAFRIILVAIILICVIWACLLIKVASDITHSDGGRPASMLARPLLDARTGVRSRLGRMIRQEIGRLELQIRPAPLLDVEHLNSPVLIVTCERADYLERMLWRLFKHHPAQTEDGGGATWDGTANSELVGAPVVISQDGNNTDVWEVVDTYRKLFEMRLGVPLFHIEHQVAAGPPTKASDFYVFPDDISVLSYKRIASHYGWALEQVFSGAAYGHHQQHGRRIPPLPLPQRVIVLEEDLEISSDFFSLMAATAGLLDADDTLLAVSAFNDNGEETFVADPTRLVRSDFFPGLGWMLSRGIWEGTPAHPDAGLRRDWAPGGYWDDWLRESARRQGRQVIRPEVSRSFHFGNIHGASEGAYNRLLNQIELEQRDVGWGGLDLSYLDPTAFAASYWRRVSRAWPVAEVAEAKGQVAHRDVRLVYDSFNAFRRLAEAFDIMGDEKAGVPRTAYEGIVEIRYGRGEYFVYLTPPYVTEGEMPAHFGKKTWMEYSKESLMETLGIKDAPIDYFPPLEWENI